MDKSVASVYSLASVLIFKQNEYNNVKYEIYRLEKPVKINEVNSIKVICNIT